MSGVGMMLLGAGGAKVTLTDLSVNAILTASPATAGYRLNTNGKVYSLENATYFEYENWVVPNSAASGFEALATIVSGTLTAGSSATGSWLALSSTREWFITTLNPPYTKTTSLTVQIRQIGTATTLATSNVTLSADGSP